MDQPFQAGLALGFLAVFVAAIVVGARWPATRPPAFATGVIAGSHALFYILFVWFPDVLNGTQTMLFSIVLRYEVLGLVALTLALAVLRDRRWAR